MTDKEGGKPMQRSTSLQSNLSSALSIASTHRIDSSSESLALGDFNFIEGEAEDKSLAVHSRRDHRPLSLTRLPLGRAQGTEQREEIRDKRAEAL